MNIFSEGGYIIFRCAFCKETAKVKPGLNKRQFMRKLNKFSRYHDEMCPAIIRIEQSRKNFDAAGVEAFGIIQKIIGSAQLFGNPEQLENFEQLPRPTSASVPTKD